MVKLILAEPSAPAVYCRSRHNGFERNVPGRITTPGIWSSLLNTELASSMGVTPSLSVVVRAKEAVTPS